MREALGPGMPCAAIRHSPDRDLNHLQTPPLQGLPHYHGLSLLLHAEDFIETSVTGGVVGYGRGQTKI